MISTGGLYASTLAPAQRALRDLPQLRPEGWPVEGGCVSPGAVARSSDVRSWDDEQLLAELQHEDLRSPRAALLRSRLWEYALPVVKSMLRSGRIREACRQHGVIVRITPTDREALHTSIQERDALAVDTITRGERYFMKKVIRTRRWSPDGGASLETYFVGACLLAFPRAYDQWSRERSDRLARLQYGLIPLMDKEQPTGAAADPELLAVQRDLVGQVFARASTTARAIMNLIASDHTYAEIGVLLGLSERAVEGHMYRLRKSVKHLDAEHGHLSVQRSGNAA